MTDLDDLIDLMEGELDQEEVQAMELLFRHSRNDRRAFLNLTHLRDAVESTDPMENLRADQQSRITSVKYQNKLTEKIMGQITAFSESAKKVEEARKAQKAFLQSDNYSSEV